jgi:Xaa-Pro aminopeptidase
VDFDYTARRDRIARVLRLTNEILLVAAGLPIPKPEVSDQQLRFIAHQEYYYLTGLADSMGCIIAFDPQDRVDGRCDGGWVSFVPKVTEAEIVWEGRTQLPGKPLGEFEAWLAGRRGRNIIALGAPTTGITIDEALTADVRERLQHARRTKEPAEIELMRRCASKTAAGYASMLPFLRAGFTEYRIQIELEAEYFRRGATATGYDTIVGAGPNSAVLHRAPSHRPVMEGEFVLIDSGAELERYVIDVTRTYVAGKPSPFQRDLYQVVLNAQLRAISRCQPGVEWKDIHFGAALDLVAGLVTMGVMYGDPELLVEQDAHLLFFPHGIGHMVGLGVRDASGLEPGRRKDPRPAMATLRMDLILRAGYIVTIEPGLYFIPTLLNNPVNRAQFHACVNWPLVEKHLGLGGVRVEDTVLVTAGPPENLTRAIPKVL